MKAAKKIQIKKYVKWLLLAGFFVWVTFEAYKSLQEDKETFKGQILKSNIEDLQTIDLINGERRIHLIKKDFRWHLVKPLNDFADSEVISSWLGEISSFEGREVDLGSQSESSQNKNSQDKKSIEPNWNDFGLDHPIAKFIVSAKDGRRLQVFVSAKDTFDGQTYLKVIYNDESPKLFVSDKKWRTRLLKLPEDFRDTSLFSWTSQDWKSLKKLSWLRETQSFSLHKNKKDLWTVDPETVYPASSSKIFAFLDDLSKFRTSGFPSAEEIKKSLKKEPSLRIKTYFYPKEGLDRKEQTLSFYKISDKSEYYVYNSLGQRWVKIEKESLKSINPSVVNFFELKFDFDVKSAKELFISNVGYFIKKDGLWKESDKLEPKDNGKDFDGAKVNVLLEKLSKLKASRFVSEDIQVQEQQLLREFHIIGPRWQKKLKIYNQIGSSVAGQGLEDTYLAVDPEKNLPFWLLKSDAEALFLVEIYKDSTPK